MTAEVLARVDGARVEITPKTIELQKLKDFLDVRGLPITVKPRTAKAALREAQHMYCKNHPDGFKTRVEALDSRRRSVASFEAISVIQGTDANSYPQRFKATVIANRVFCTHPTVDAHDLQQLYDEMIVMAPVGSVRAAVVEFIEGYLNGVKAATDVYWLPEQSMERWRKFASGLSNLGCLDSYTIATNLDDPDTIRWVGDKIKESIARISADVQEGLTERTLKDATVSKRRDQIAAERQKLQLFEAALGKPLESCRDLLLDADEALAQKAAVADDDFADMWE
jgi:hypothetical protein